MDHAWTLVLGVLLLAVSIPGNGRAQGLAPTPPPLPADAPEPDQAEDVPPDVQTGRLQKQLAELKKQRGGLIEKLVAEYRARPESLRALGDRDEARAALKAATVRVLTAVRETPRYRAKLAEKQESLARQQALKALAKPDLVQIAQAAAAHCLASLKLAQMEGDATSTDPELIDMRARVARAEAAVTRLQTEAEAYAIASDGYAHLVQAVVQTRTEINAIEAATRVRELPPRISRESMELFMLRAWARGMPSGEPSRSITYTPGKRKSGLPIGTVITPAPNRQGNP